MGSCTRRHYLLAICILQLLTIIERQVMDFLGYMWAPILVNFFHIIFVIFGFFGAYQFRPKYIVTYSVWNVVWIGWNIFLVCFYMNLTIIERQVMDFLGYMWAPILVNFFHIIFVIFGFFGAYQFRPKYIVTYSVWNVVWIGWNIFLVCFYMNVGSLDRESDVLNLGTGSFSWFLINGYGCKPIYPTNITSEDPFRPIRPERVENCLVEFQTVEVIHSSIQIIFAILGIIGAITIGKIFIEEDDDRSSRGSVGTSKHRQSLYTIDFTDTIRSGHHRDDLVEFGEDGRGQTLSPKPMTPRRVKRRSVMTRGSSGRQSNSSRRSSNRNSVRNSRRRMHHQNPVTKLMEQQTTAKAYPTFAPHKENSALTASNLKTLNSDLTNLPPAADILQPPNHMNQLQKLPPPTNPDPITTT
uniref:Sodium/potassium-transporting ATPase subunit beta-1-interacting protein n=1 Tax=Lutzomyia longipalpis TaxID=7200 RepID=A0A1B0CBW5_LUTLO